MTVTEKGTARSPGISYQQLLDADTHEVPKILREESPRFFGDEDLPIDHYISRRVARAGEGTAVAPGVAVRLPRGAHPSRR